MIAKSIYAKDFRNIREATVAFSEGVNVIVGDNAMGKTSILEGIYYCAQGKSHRAVRDRELIRFGALAACLSLTYDSFPPFSPSSPSFSPSPVPDMRKENALSPASGMRKENALSPAAGVCKENALSSAADMRKENALSPASGVCKENALSVTFYTGGGAAPAPNANAPVRKGYNKNGVTLARVSEFIGHFKAVLFTPDHLSLIKEGPALRRGFLDGALCQLDRRYLLTLQRYQKILKNRNCLLSQAAENGDPRLMDSLEGWSRQLAEAAADIARMRYAYVKALSEGVASFFADMSAGRKECERPAIGYPEPLDEEGYFALFTTHLRRELGAATTLYGPHRDDLSIALNDREARVYASQGQQRSLALAMKMAEGAIIQKSCGEAPVYLFDDLLSELDDRRRAYLLSGLTDRQVILTACRMSDFPPHSRVIVCHQGEYTG